MKTLSRRLSTALLATLIGAFLTAGCERFSVSTSPRPDETTLSTATPVPLQPSPSVALLAPSPALPAPSPSPLPRRDARELRIAVDERPSAVLFLALPRFIRDHQNDLRLKCVVVPNAAERWQMLAAGHVDLVCGTLDSFVLAAMRNVPGEVLFEVDESIGQDALVARNSTDMHAMKGRPIAVVGGAGGRRLVAYFLNSAKMLLTDVQFIETDDASDALELLRADRVDGAVLFPPFLQKALRDPSLRVVARTSETLSHPLEICAVSRAALDRRKADVLTFTRHWFALEELLRDRTVGIGLIALNTGRPAAEVAEQLEGCKRFSLADNQHMEPRRLAEEIRALQDFWRITDEPNTSARIDPERLVQIDLVRQIRTDEETPAASSPAAEASGGSAEEERAFNTPSPADASGAPSHIEEAPASQPSATP